MPEVRGGLLWRSADRRTDAETLRHFMGRARRVQRASQNAAANWESDVTWQVTCPVAGNIYPWRGCPPERVVAAGHTWGEILAGPFFCFRRARRGWPQIAEFRARVWRAIPSSRAAGAGSHRCPRGRETTRVGRVF